MAQLSDCMKPKTIIWLHYIKGLYLMITAFRDCPLAVLKLQITVAVYLKFWPLRLLLLIVLLQAVKRCTLAI